MEPLEVGSLPRSKLHLVQFIVYDLCNYILNLSKSLVIFV